VRLSTCVVLPQSWRPLSRRAAVNQGLTFVVTPVGNSVCRRLSSFCVFVFLSFFLIQLSDVWNGTDQAGGQDGADGAHDEEGQHEPADIIEGGANGWT